MSETPAQTKEPLPLHKPEFDGGSFTIEYLSRSAEGFEVRTNKSLKRREAESFPFSQVNRQHPERAGKLKVVMPGQMRYAEGDKAAKALEQLRKEQNEPARNTEQAYKDYKEKSEFYHQKMSPSVGIENARQEGNTLVFDIRPADYPVYRVFAKPDSEPEILEYASAMVGTAMVLITKDQRFILQHRNDRNIIYGGIMGVSAAGYLQGRMYHPKPKEQPTQAIETLLPINADSVKTNILKEMKEEIGLDTQHIEALRITGLAKDKVQPHNEVLLFATTSLDSSQVKKEAENASKNLQLSDVEFMEKFIDVPATPETISILVTQVKCPFPPTQYGALILAGHSMVLQQRGRDAADNWTRDLEPKVKQNYQEINSIVAQYYQKHPEVLEQTLQGKPPRNPRGYDPAYLPQEQGLPDVMSELKRVGLIS